MEEEKGVLNLTQLVRYGKNNKSRNAINQIDTKRNQSLLSSQLKFIQRHIGGIIGLNSSDMPTKSE